MTSSDESSIGSNNEREEKEKKEEEEDDDAKSTLEKTAGASVARKRMSRRERKELAEELQERFMMLVDFETLQPLGDEVTPESQNEDENSEDNLKKTPGSILLLNAETSQPFLAKRETTNFYMQKIEYRNKTVYKRVPIIRPSVPSLESNPLLANQEATVTGSSKTIIRNNIPRIVVQDTDLMQRLQLMRDNATTEQNETNITQAAGPSRATENEDANIFTLFPELAAHVPRREDVFERKMSTTDLTRTLTRMNMKPDFSHMTQASRLIPPQRV